MKLYEFDYVDTVGLTKEQLEAKVEKVLKQEALFQKWGSYCFTQKRKVIKDNNQVVYSFIVVGEYD